MPHDQATRRLGRHAEQLADGPGLPVVLSHALGLDATLWSELATRWQGQRPVLVYDQRGHGRARRQAASPPSPYAMADLVQDAAELVQAWGRGPVVFIGLSMGGMVGQGLAIHRPACLAGLVLAHTVSRYDEAARAAWRQRVDQVRQHGMAAVIDTVLSRYLTPEIRAQNPGLEAALRQRLLGNDPAAYALACEAVAGVDWSGQVGGIACPTLVIGGARDQGVPPAALRQLHAAIPGSRFELLEQASHLGPLETPQAFWAAVETFIESLETQP